MGLFGSKRETIIGTSVTRVIKDEMLPSAIKTGVMRSLFYGEKDVDAILDEVTSSIGLKAQRMYEYAKDRYIHGLPNKTLVTQVSLEQKITSALSAHHGSSVSLTYGKFGPLNNLHAGWHQLYTSYGYDALTNQIGSLTTVKGAPVYLKDITVVVREITANEQLTGELEFWDNPREGTLGYEEWGSLVRRLDANRKVHVDSRLAADQVRVDYTWAKDRKQFDESMIIPLTGFDEEADYFQVKYTLNGVPKILTYLDNSGGIPGLDDIFTTEFNGSGSFFPIGYLRWQKKRMDTNKETREYKDSVKLFKYLGIDFDDMVSAIEGNPDIKDVEQAMLTMAVPANTTSPIEQRYLFDFFKQLYGFAGGTGNSKPPIMTPIMYGFSEDRKTTSLVIQDAKFKMVLAYDTLHKKTRVGNIGTVGSYSSGRGTYTDKQSVVQTNYETGETSQVEETYTFPTHYYRKQITATMYEEYEIANLQMTYFITEKYRTTGDENDKILMIPIDHSVTTKYSIIDREELYSRSLHYIFNSMRYVKVKWYQQEWFGELLMVAAIVMTIASLGSDSGMFIQTAAAIAAALALTIPLWVIQVVLIYAVQEAFKQVTKVIGGDLALIFAVAMAAYGGYTAFGSSAGVNSIAFSSFTAKDLMFIASGLSGGVSANTAVAFDDLLDEQKAFASAAESKMKLIDDANKLLGSQMDITPFVVFGESPDDFYRRTVHSGNIGTLSYDYIHNYVDMNLTLPKLAQTIGDFN